MDSIRASFWKVLCFERFFLSRVIVIGIWFFLFSLISLRHDDFSVDGVTTFRSIVDDEACVWAWVWVSERIYGVYNFFGAFLIPFFLSHTNTHKMCETYSSLFGTPARTCTHITAHTHTLSLSPSPPARWAKENYENCTRRAWRIELDYGTMRTWILSKYKYYKIFPPEDVILKFFSRE